jgi:hypothetical protein
MEAETIDSRLIIWRVLLWTNAEENAHDTLPSDCGRTRGIMMSA